MSYSMPFLPYLFSLLSMHPIGEEGIPTSGFHRSLCNNQPSVETTDANLLVPYSQLMGGGYYIPHRVMWRSEWAQGKGGGYCNDQESVECPQLSQDGVIVLCE